ncbi:MAG: hypothetical protein RIF33_03655 [Cyclobacteriaceae bacterium]
MTGVLAKAGTRVGAIGVGFGAAVGGFNIATGHGQLSDAVDLVVGGVATAIVIFNPAAAVAGAGLVYGGIMIFGGEDAINNLEIGGYQVGKSTEQFLDWR